MYMYMYAYVFFWDNTLTMHTRRTCIIESATRKKISLISNTGSSKLLGNSCAAQQGFGRSGLQACIRPHGENEAEARTPSQPKDAPCGRQIYGIGIRAGNALQSSWDILGPCSRNPTAQEVLASNRYPCSGTLPCHMYMIDRIWPLLESTSADKISKKFSVMLFPVSTSVSSGGLGNS